MGKPPAHNVIGIVYDFDGTLSPHNMQEDTIFKAYGLHKNDIWNKADELVKTGYERTLAYLKLLIHDEAFQKRPLKREMLRDLATQIEYFPGVVDYFQKFDSFLKEIPEIKNWNIRVEHYIISSGMKEILEGSEIFPFFKKVYACEYEYNERGAVFPKLVINDTNKTQFLFRISKGKLELNEDINSHMPEAERPIPFRNMVYIGDSLTDIPSMTVIQKNQGHAIAVFDPAKSVPEKVKAMVMERRVDHFAPADFRSGSLLRKILKITTQKIACRIAYEGSVGMSRDWIKRDLEAGHKRSLTGNS